MRPWLREAAFAWAAGSVGSVELVRSVWAMVAVGTPRPRLLRRAGPGYVLSLGDVLVIVNCFRFSLLFLGFRHEACHKLVLG